MKKPLLKLILFAGIPVMVIIVLFKINVYLGIAGIISYIAALVLFNMTYIYIVKGQIEYRKGNLEKAASWYEKASKSKKAPINATVVHGFILFKTGKLEEAEKVFLSAVENSKSKDDTNMAKSNLALVLWKKGKLDDAISMLKEVIKEYKTTSIYGTLGYLAIEKGDLDEALEINLEAYDFNPDHPVIQDNLAHLYHLRGEMDKAGELFKKLIESNPHFPEAYFDYGQYLEDCGEINEAAAMYQKALSCQFNYNSTVSRERVLECYERIADKPEKNTDI
jgi:tetratricopeptide (TPR) repeat protein